MPEVHLPKLDDHDEETETSPRAAARASARHGRGKTAVRFALEVVLIGTGVFLGLMGEQWRERAQHRELAEASLRRFRTEIANNRDALAAVTAYHATLKRELANYLASGQPKTVQTFEQSGIHMTMGLGPVWSERTAWDLALATQSLAYTEPAVAFAISRAYTTQQEYGGLQLAILQSTVYGRSRSQDFEGYWQSLLAYLGDVSVFDPALLKAYEQALAQIDRALGEAAGGRTVTK